MKEQHKLTVNEVFRLPGYRSGNGSSVANFTPSKAPIRIEGGRKRKAYTAQEQRRRAKRKAKRLSQ
jgi:hypothetical protein